MTPNKSIVAIYDFELFPYALGDVLTWNVRTAMRCEELGREQVDIYICADERHPASIHQRELINKQNFELFFSELYSAFGTHPKLGNIHIFRQRESLLARLQELVVEDEINAEAVGDYLNVLEYRVSESVLNKIRRVLSKTLRSNRYVREAFNRCLPSPIKTVVRETCLPNEEVLNNYFIKYIHSHESINEFAAKRGGIPLLHPALGCTPDIDAIIARQFAGKKIVPFHLRLRRLDAGYGGEHSYTRDSDFLEWYDFLREAGQRYPEVEFIALGRLQEKPLELLSLPNVTSLRIFGMGLGHELTLMLKSDLFIGTSSGFAALANFSSVPYFITKMNPGSCHAYAIPEGAECLPFAQQNQKLIYAQETSELLMSLLESGLGLSEGRESQPRMKAETSKSGEIDVQGWLKARSRSMISAATTSRFFIDEKYRHEETAYLLLANLERVRQALVGNAHEDAKGVLRKLEKNFPDLCTRLPHYQLLKGVVASENDDPASKRACQDIFDLQVDDFIGTACSTTDTEEAGWRPLNWTVEGSEFKPLHDEPQPALTIKATGANTYWHTERFISSHSSGKIIVRLDAKNSAVSSRHRIYIFEDGSFRSVGELVTGIDWRTFEIPINTNPGSILELQIDQADDWQWLSFRNLQVLGGNPPYSIRPLARQVPVAIPMATWVGSGMPCTEIDGVSQDCRQWAVASKNGYVQTPVLPQSGEAGLLIRFEGRANRPAATFSSIYMFEGDRYRTVANYAFCSAWREFTLLLQPDRTAPIKIQIDYPDAVESLSIRNFKVTPLDWDRTISN